MVSYIFCNHIVTDYGNAAKGWWLSIDQFMETRRDVFQALADPNRRAIIHLLSGKKLTLNGVAENFEISRPAVSKHIKILTECGLIMIEQHGRERYCQATLEKLGEVSEWIAPYRKFWDARLDALDNYLGKRQSVKRKKLRRRKKH